MGFIVAIMFLVLLGAALVGDIVVDAMKRRRERQAWPTLPRFTVTCRYGHAHSFTIPPKCDDGPYDWSAMPEYRR